MTDIFLDVVDDNGNIIDMEEYTDGLRKQVKKDLETELEEKGKKLLNRGE